jgi:DNA-binding transcriptional ArsR family regulator
LLFSYIAAESYMTTATARLDATFAALADPTRRAILARLTRGEASVNELVAPFRLSQPTISKHLKVLERAGLIERRREAQFRPCRLNAAPLLGVVGWLEGYRRFWDESFERLDAYAKTLAAQEQEEGEPHEPKRKTRRR